MQVLYTISLLFLSNCFMTAAWYGNLKFHNMPLWVAILIGWVLALFEYSLLIPANRMSYGLLSAYQLKIIQECITLTVFVAFAALFLGEQISIRYGISFVLILAAVIIAFYK